MKWLVNILIFIALAAQSQEVVVFVEKNYIAEGYWQFRGYSDDVKGGEQYGQAFDLNDSIYWIGCVGLKQERRKISIWAYPEKPVRVGNFVYNKIYEIEEDSLIWVNGKAVQRENKPFPMSSSDMYDVMITLK